jgi:hypothetical protein
MVRANMSSAEPGSTHDITVIGRAGYGWGCACARPATPMAQVSKIAHERVSFTALFRQYRHLNQRFNFAQILEFP